MALGGADNLARSPELRTKLLWTLGLLCAYRIGVHIPVPGVDGGALAHFFESVAGTLFGLFDMFSGTQQTVRLRFENRLAGAVIDRFGKEISLIPQDEGYFTVSVSVAVSPPVFSDGWRDSAPASASWRQSPSGSRCATTWPPSPPVMRQIPSKDHFPDCLPKK